MVEVMGRMEVWPLLLVLFISAVEVLVLIARAQDQHPDLGFISIDCGASEAHTRETLSLQYDTDERFIRSGKNGQVASQYYSVINRELRSLRYFPDGNRNCYLLRPNQGISNRYLIRASFFHGSYDGNPETPTFDLHIDVNRWTTISLPNTSSPITKEIIYTTYRDYIHVCLVNTDSGVPFISLLELRILDDSIYGTSGPSTALKSYKRYNFGAQVTTYRYPQDPYDRIWQSDKPDGTDFTVITNTTNVDSLKSFNDAYKVPTEVLMTAVASFDSSEGLRLSPYSTSIDKWLVCLHFAEIEVLQSGQVRKLSVNVNEGPVPAEDSSVTAEYLKPITVNLTTPILTKGMNISILQKSGSDLPAFLNAAEVFTALNLSNLQTEILSVKALNDIMTRYPGVFEDEWQGDPCVPPEFTWEGLKCSYADSPRITYLNLSNKGLKGRIADAFHNLTSLESLDLSSNGLTGQLPEYLGFLPMLKFLNLSGNNFCGEIPDSLREKNSSTEFILSLSENSYHNFPCPAVPNPKKKRTAIIPVSVGVASVTLIIILCLVAGVCFCSMRKRRQGVSRGTHVTKEETTSFVNVTSSKDASATMSSEGSLGIVNKNRPFTSNEVSVITQNFKEIIGGGAFGNVYLGALDDGTKVAVKVLSPSSRQGYKEFQAEAKLLTIVHHKNLVSLIGYCDIPENLSLVYEYMSNGNLRQHLSEHAIEALSWIERLQIGIDAAQGLEYLHNGCRPPIVHRDLKTSNILLNNKMQAKIADFGLSRVLASDQDTDISTRPAGTPGYLDPMFHASGKLNKKSDVYSFGIILLELVTGHLAIIRDSKDGTHIVQWVSPLVEKGDTERIVDPRIHGQFDRNSAKKAIETAMQCVQLAAVQRPDISRVVSELKECLAIQTRSRIRQADNIRSDSFEMTYPETHMASASST